MQGVSAIRVFPGFPNPTTRLREPSMNFDRLLRFGRAAAPPLQLFFRAVLGVEPAVDSGVEMSSPGIAIIQAPPAGGDAPASVPGEIVYAVKGMQLPWIDEPEAAPERSERRPAPIRHRILYRLRIQRQSAGRA